MSKARKTMPVLTIAGVLLPAICVGAAFILGTGNRGSGGWGLGEIAIFVSLILAGAVLGAVSTLLGLLRGEPWRPLQAIVVLATVGVALFLGLPFLRGRPAPPMPIGEAAYLEIRVNQMGWGVPVGIADQERRAVDSPR